MQWLKEENFDRFKAWSGGQNTIDTVQRAGKFSELSDLMEEITNPDTCGKIWTDTEINDFLWYDTEYIYQYLGITEDGRDIEAFWDMYDDQLEWIYQEIQDAFNIFHYRLKDDDLEDIYIEWLEEKNAPYGTTIILPEITSCEYEEQIEALEWVGEFLNSGRQQLVSEFINYCHDCNYFAGEEEGTKK